MNALCIKDLAQKTLAGPQDRRDRNKTAWLKWAVTAQEQRRYRGAFPANPSVRSGAILPTSIQRLV
jgi:hypothetical protein